MNIPKPGTHIRILIGEPGAKVECNAVVLVPGNIRISGCICRVRIDIDAQHAWAGRTIGVRNPEAIVGICH